MASRAVDIVGELLALGFEVAVRDPCAPEVAAALHALGHDKRCKLLCAKPLLFPRLAQEAADAATV